ncbi:hypothetical protein ACFO1B_23335 [Dactylosporangium siamense]|uniref:hypothetical protein n=1 Tax=Dactylosporangium siamense TaxID=685454 RepID=UPI001944E354|nr:hypothetical protein [Dactylosporangium siamense]
MRRSVVPVSALAFGVSGWLMAHLVTSWLLAHQHEAAHGVAAGVGHVHARDAALAVLVAALTGVALLAVACAVSLRPGAAPAGVRQAGRWSVGVFLAAESAGFAFSEQHVVPPPLVLLAGLAVHALCAATAAVLCRRGVEGILIAAAALAGVPISVEQPAPGGFGPPPQRRSRRLSLRRAGRGPPRWSVFA